MSINGADENGNRPLEEWEKDMLEYGSTAKAASATGKIAPVNDEDLDIDVDVDVDTIIAEAGYGVSISFWELDSLNAPELGRMVAALKSATRRGNIQWSLVPTSEPEPEGPTFNCMGNWKREATLTVWSTGGQWKQFSYWMQANVTVSADDWGCTEFRSNDLLGKIWVGSGSTDLIQEFTGTSVSWLIAGLVPRLLLSEECLSQMGMDSRREEFAANLEEISSVWKATK